ncbi:hypothetical protein [Acuticoccus yangtzensis]|uniref:hypothetical protein n=1 Tax=Acuticoccus yangtzensis TaxID=1443441 RepID=UPI001300AE81|nr:hypothetical protein [Acuticoccus yangtzensis]
MKERDTPFLERKRMTSLGEALAKRLEALGSPLVSDYVLFREMWAVFERGEARYLRGEYPSREQFQRTRALLKQERVIINDADYGRMWRVLSVSDEPADEIVCLADPHGYISHLSAMQRYGLTERRPEALFLTLPAAALVKELNAQLFASDYQGRLPEGDVYVPPLKNIAHPKRVRKRLLNTYSTRRYGKFRRLRGKHARIATIGQTFLDMLDLPARCGGMLHVLSVWAESAPIYLEEIIARVDAAQDPILKVRAGYILDEQLGITDRRVLAWKSFAQRGSSRVLDPGEPFRETHSEEWMLSINVG